MRTVHDDDERIIFAAKHELRNRSNVSDASSARQPQRHHEILCSAMVLVYQIQRTSEYN